ncbi:uncharacterized protein GGS22DRAFT_196910 [Annulohypoxylon maeteangense]|uniref:uncharacterized protein n=1 Tax=Annulohypoxylon maeteangense TaxID=1927788 RepID=UPI0020073CA5|nr:uncharacterized protein GGS22DRAFT_196910 [Annulohypoxylon maeteangense]KAI0889329.1 hypothetical protein GGS22DRAFT_196910 [Annulohypoxylon maeteangense]
MTSYTSREPEHIPGSFPTDDMLSTPTEQSNLASPASHPHHNKLHKREDPRGWVGEGKAARGHQHTDSGVGLTDTNALDYHTQSKANEKAFQSNQPFLQRHAQPDTPSNIADAKPVNQHEIGGKPGVMTGAYSRLDENNRTYPKPAPQDSTRQETNTARGVPGSATRGASLVTPEAGTKAGIDNRGVEQNNLMQSSQFEQDDPYWGDVPYGTGIYNTVTGHGSSETPAEGSAHLHDPHLSHNQDRSFPLSTHNTSLRNEPDNDNGSKFKGGIAAGTAAGAGAGLVASQVPRKQQDHHHERGDLEEPTSHQGEDKGASTGSKIVSFFYRDHKDKDTKPEKHEAKKEKHSIEPAPSKNDSPLTKRDAGAALAAATVTGGTKDNARQHGKPQAFERRQDSKTNALYEHPDEEIDNQNNQTKDPPRILGYTDPHRQSGMKDINKPYPSSDDTATRGYLSSQSRPTEQNDSKLGYGLGAAGLGAGAGYAIHEHANRGARNQGQSTQAMHEKLTTLPSETSTQPIHPSHINDRAQYGMVAGTTAPISSSAKQSLPQASEPHAKSSHTQPSHRNQYYILPDGTPSGMNIGDHSDNMMSSETAPLTTESKTASKNDHTGAKLGAAGAGVVGAGTAAHHVGRQSNDNPTTSGTRKDTIPSSTQTHEPYMETTGSQAPNPTPTGQRSGQYILRETMRTNNPARDHSGDKNPTTPHPAATAKESQHTGSKAATAAAAGALVAGAGAAAHHHGKNDSAEAKVAPSGSTRDQRSATTSSTQAPGLGGAKSHVRNRASTDSSHDGQYNVLASGTPSGINREHLVHGELGGVDEEVKGGAVRSAGMETGREKEMGMGRTGLATGAGASAGAGMAAIAARALKAGDPVVHRCGRCGEENDITGYFHE